MDTQDVDCGNSFTFLKQPEHVGYWVLYPGNGLKLKLTVYRRPTDEQIRNTEALLGRGWEDA